MPKKQKQRSLKLRDNLRSLRQGLKDPDGNFFTQQRVASDIGICTASLQNAEAGIVPGDAVLMKLARYYQVTEDHLLGRESYSDEQDKPPPQTQDRDGLFGRTKQVDIDGQRFAVTTHEPSAKSQFLEPLAMLSEILASGDPILVQAIKANLRAFQTAILNRRQATDNAQQLNDLQQECAALKQRNEDQEKRLAALEKRLDEATPGKGCAQDRRDDTDEDQVDPGRRAAA